ncbi:MAG: EAL domain-containing protein [Magnetococcales bacterium]|nr:EAL domain-containing protein [Magnetococcales bacterium]
MTAPISSDSGISIHDIKEGLDRNEFLFHYQPKVSFLTGRMIGAEALIRWNRGGTLVPPGAFIPLSEQTGFITLITEHMFEQLLQDLERIPSLSDERFGVAFNISAHDLQSDRLLKRIRTARDSGRVDSRALQFELTETILADLSSSSIQMMHDFSNLGITLALDDFGTGYSSLEVLSTFPFSMLKLDRSIVRHIVSRNKASRIVNANIRMAQHIGLRTVAEGIEDEETYNTLMYSGCNQGQGYFIARPMPLESLIDLLYSPAKWSGNSVGLIYQAQLDHLQWRKEVIELFYYICNNGIGEEITKDETYRYVTGDHTVCNLGKWYYGDGRMYGHIGLFQQLESVHVRLHQVGRALLNKAVRSGKTPDALHDISEINALSGEVIRLLQNLENHVHMDISDQNTRSRGRATTNNKSLGDEPSCCREQTANPFSHRLSTPDGGLIMQAG